MVYSFTTDHGSIMVDGNTATLSGLTDIATVTRTVTNPCTGDSATDDIVITPVDNVAPVAIAEDLVNVTLTPQSGGVLGSAKIPYQAIDAGSNDQNCGDVTICIFRTSDGEFTGTGDDAVDNCADAVIVGCGDVGTLVDVTIRVSDGTNTAFAWGQISVEDKVITGCEDGTLMLDCFDDVVSQLPARTLITSCETIALVPSTPEGPDNCGRGQEVIQYTLPAGYLAMDRFSQFTGALCEVTITYEGGGDAFDGSTIVFPADEELTCGDAIPDASLDLDDLKCNLVAYSAEDSDFLQDDQACGKIIRNFTVID